MVVLNYIIWVLWAGSLSGAVFMIAKKMPALMALPEDSLEYKETLVEFLKRKKNEISPAMRRVEISLLEGANKGLLKFKIVFLRIYNITHRWTETLNDRLHHRRKKIKEIAEKAESDRQNEENL